MTGTFQTLPRQFRCSTFKTTAAAPSPLNLSYVHPLVGGDGRSDFGEFNGNNGIDARNGDGGGFSDNNRAFSAEPGEFSYRNNRLRLSNGGNAGHESETEDCQCRRLSEATPTASNRLLSARPPRHQYLHIWRILRNDIRQIF